MSFSSEVKNELCKIWPSKPCCALAELYGMLLYASQLSDREIRIYTATPRLGKKLIQLSAAALGHSLPWEISSGTTGRSSLSLTDVSSVRELCRRFDYDCTHGVIWHLNGWHIIDDCCRDAFLRGMFLTGGYVADPETGYSIELSGTHAALAREISALLGEMDMLPGYVRRRDEHVLYYKDADSIEAFLTHAGAHHGVIRLMEARVIRDMRNRINRKVNCETSNLMRTVEKAGDHMEAIEKIRAAGKLGDLEPGLLQAVRLREEYPDASLAELAAMCEPPISKSGFNHRMKKLEAIASALSGRTQE